MLYVMCYVVIFVDGYMRRYRYRLYLNVCVWDKKSNFFGLIFFKFDFFLYVIGQNVVQDEVSRVFFGRFLFVSRFLSF